MKASDFLERIAPCEEAMLNSLFNPVSFSDGGKGTYSGFIRQCRDNRVDFNYAGHDGRNWYSYTLDPSSGLLTFLKSMSSLDSCWSVMEKGNHDQI